jgi:HAD superfamily phosphatase (TIGR01668 family)
MKAVMSLKKFYADAYFENITKISTEFLKEHGIEGVILDVDNTLVGHNVKVPEEKILFHIRQWEKEGIKLCVVSNNTEKRVKSFCEKINIKYYVSDALKPRKKGYINASCEMKLEMGKIAAIGDQVFTDVWAAHNAGVRAILVPPINDKRDLFTRFKRLLERPILRKYERIHREREENIK